MNKTVLLKIIGGGFTTDIAMQASATISDLKSQLKMLMNVDIERQTLMFNGEELMDHQIIGDYEFGQSPTLALDIAPTGKTKFNILVKFGTEQTHIMVDETRVVADLRAEIARHWGIPIENTTLFCGLPMEMKDHLTLSAYNISEHSKIEVKVKARTG
ncbi:hypothetical protein Pint_08122 [Pistacia integerrima]|uniref:Uncharacterized protein n=1 Tax=Pistacia integerrima TaxID=434235 RepID=A0ACC0XVL3_9ROSI|nr:hypothetical protein Pint_08122 [Pistacia integerrima]